ncbi:glycosyltransferase family 2 protein [Candidatus Woesebacteria bacterium]|nr:glycosyltransferase family 2 protein [Candidatus Woesebacteria bacterium]
MIKNMPLVSVIMVSYNTRDYTVKAMQSALNSQGFKPGEIEVIMIDNNSPDDSVAYTKEHLPQVKVIANKDNKGFGGGNNQGAKIATGKYLLLLNPDAFLEKDSLRIMVDIMESHQDIVSVGPQLRFVDGSMQQSAGYLPTPLRVMAWMWWLDKLPIIKKLFPQPYHVYDLEWHKQDHDPEWLMGACIMFRKAEFLTAGGFDDKIFMYAEEVELYRRLNETLHKKVHFTTKTKVVHVGSVSTKKANAYRLSYELQGIEYIYAKHYPNLLWFIKFVINTGVIMRLILFSLIPSRRDTLVEYKKFFQRNK